MERAADLEPDRAFRAAGLRGRAGARPPRPARPRSRPGPGALRFAARTTPAARRLGARGLDLARGESQDRRHRAGRSSPAWYMSSPRRCVSRSASSNDSAPAATHAEYSPRLCPATNAGVTPAASTTSRHAATLCVSSAGCVLHALLQVLRGAVPAQRAEREAERRGPRSRTPRAPPGGASASARPMPTRLRALPGEQEGELHDARLAAAAASAGSARSRGAACVQRHRPRRPRSRRRRTRRSRARRPA